MAKELRFDVSALDQASKTFARMGAAVEAFERRLEKLDGKRVDAEIGVKTDQAERQVGRFATDTRRKLVAALSNLPELELDANSTELDRKLVDVRRRMAELADKTIGIDLSAEEAIAEAQVLQRELDDLARTSPDIRVRTDAAAASAELAKISAEADKLDAKTTTIKVKTDKSFSDATIDIALLGRSLAALAIPAGIVAAAPPILALGQAAVTASGSLLLIPAAATAAGLAVGTLTLGFQGFGDAIGDDPKKAAEAMAELAPAAREAARAVQGLRPAWDALRLNVQQELFEGLGEQITALGGQYLPILRAGMADVAQGFNYGATQVAVFLRQASTASTVSTMFTDLGDTIENLATTFRPLTSVFVDLGAVGAKVLTDITQGAGAATERFAAFIAQARGTGQLEAWMRNGVNALKQLGEVTVNVGSALASMMRAAGVASGDFLGKLVDLTGRMREFLSSAQGQQAMITVFEGINRVVSALTPGIVAAGRALAQMASNSATTGALEAIATALSRLVEAAAPVIVAFTSMTASAIRPFVGILGGLAPVIGPVIGALVALKVAASAVKFVGMITGLSTLGAAAGGVVGRLGAARAAMTGAATAAAASGTATAAAGAAAGTAAAGFGRAGNAAADSTGKFSRLRAGAGALVAGFNPLVLAAAAAGAAIVGVGAFASRHATSLDEMRAAVQAGGPPLDALKQKLGDQRSVLDAATGGLFTARTGMDEWVRTNIYGMASTEALNAEIAKQEGELRRAAAAAGVSVGTYQLMNGALDRSSAAAQQVTDNLTRIGPAMSGIKDGVAPTKEMQAALDATAGSARTAAQDAGLSAQALGGVGAGADQAAVSMQASRDAFIQTATSAGMTGEKAAELADKLGLIPAKARTDFETNAATTALEVQQVSDKLREVPVGKSVTVNAMTAPAQQAITSLGVTVRTLPNGQVEVTANTAEAKANLDLFLRGAQERRTEVRIDGQTQPAQQALSNVLAQIAAGKSQINIDGNSYPAEQVLGYLLGTVSGTNAQIVINGNAQPAELVVNSLMEAIRTKSPTVDIKGNKVPIDQVLAAVTASAGQPVNKPITADGGPATGVVDNLNRLIGTPTNKPIGATTPGAEGAVANLNSLITAPATKPIGGDNTGGLSANDLLTGAVQTPALKPVGGDNTGGLSANELLNGAVRAPATKPIEGNNSGGLSANELLAGAVQTGATKPIDGNNAGGMGANSGLVGAVESTATKPMAGNPAGANSANRGVVDAVQTPATKPVNANDSGARGVVSTFVGWVAGLVATVSVVANKIGFAGGGIMPMADGGIVSPAPRRIVPLAAGDVGDPNTFAGHTLNPMPANQAKIVGANTWRVIGDRPSGDELFLPLVKSSATSQALLEAGAARMGRQLVPKGMSLQPGPGVQVAPMAEGGMVTAARAIVGRMNSRQQLFEDWTWKGAPAVVGQYNDELHDARRAAGYSYADGKRFLEDYIRRNTAAASAPAAAPSAAAVRAQVQAAQAAKAAAPQVNVATGLDVAQLKIIAMEVRGLRGDLGSGQGWPEVATRLDALIGLAARGPGAAARAGALRDISGMGGFGA